MQIWFYKRDCQIFDLVYHDGSFSDKLNKNKTPIGMCFYIDSANRERRLMVALTHPSQKMQWGIFISTNPAQGFASIELKDSPGYEVGDTPIDNSPNAGVSPQSVTQDTIIDKESPDGFKQYDPTTAIGQLGFSQLSLEFAYRGKRWDAGDYIPISLYNTLLGINHRDKICKDSNINLELPETTENKTELENLLSLIEEIVSDNNNQSTYSQYYYPALSIAHAYEPKINEGYSLNERFKCGNWALPTLGELARICWYYMRATANAPEAIQLKQWINLGVFPQLRNSYYWSITEQNANFTWVLNLLNGTIYGGGGYSCKFYENEILPIAAF